MTSESISARFYMPSTVYPSRLPGIPTRIACVGPTTAGEPWRLPIGSDNSSVIKSSISATPARTNLLLQALSSIGYEDDGDVMASLAAPLAAEEALCLDQADPTMAASAIDIMDCAAPELSATSRFACNCCRRAIVLFICIR